jgi:hypothetical protein
MIRKSALQLREINLESPVFCVRYGGFRRLKLADERCGKYKIPRIAPRIAIVFFKERKQIA